MARDNDSQLPTPRGGNLLPSVARAVGEVSELSLSRPCSGCLRVCPSSIREGSTEEAVLGLRLEGWLGVYQLSNEESASRHMSLLWS